MQVQGFYMQESPYREEEHSKIPKEEKPVKQSRKVVTDDNDIANDERLVFFLWEVIHDLKSFCPGKFQKSFDPDFPQ